MLKNKLTGWLKNIQNQVLSDSSSRRRAKNRRNLTTQPSHSELLEDRTLLTPILVTSLNDGPPAADGVTTLREAINEANAFPDFDIISFAPGLTGTISLTEGELFITRELEIAGPGAAGDIVIDAQQNSRVILATGTSDNLTLTNLTVKGGAFRQQAPIVTQGAGIFFEGSGDLTLNNVTVTLNTVVGTPASSNKGGGVYSAFGDVRLNDSFLANNITGFGLDARGGGVFTQDGDVVLTNSDLVSNSSGQGGGIYTENGDITVQGGSAVQANIASDLGAGIRSGDGFVAVTDSVVLLNQVNDFAGGGGGIFSIDGDVTIANSTFFNNTSNRGGAIESLFGDVTAESSAISNNISRGKGGAIRTSNGDVVLVGSTLSGNTSAGTGGAVSGGAGADVTVINSTIAKNTATGIDGLGGGIFADFAEVKLINSTIADNSASVNGGGIAFRGGTSQEFLTMHNSIVIDNLGGSGPDILAPDGGLANLDVRHSVLGLNGGTALLATGGVQDANGNFINVAVSQILELESGNPKLADNGGSVHTIALASGSKAIDAGDNDLAEDQNGNELVNDQRGFGFSRFLGPLEFVDIGAYETPLIPFPGELIVDSTADGIDGDLSAGEFTLREAVKIANTQSGAESITIDASLAGSTIALTEGELTISDDLSIHGPTGFVTIDGQQNSRVIRATNNVTKLTLDSLIITGGLTTGDGEVGGGIRFDGQPGSTLQIANSQISDNQTTGAGAFGGAIDVVSGDLVLINSLVSDNSTNGSLADGGAISAINGSVTLVNTTLYGNVSSGNAGGIFLENADLSLSSSTVVSNSADGSGGGFLFAPGGNVNIFNSIVAANSDTGVSPDFNAASGSSSVVDVRSSYISSTSGNGLTAGNSNLLNVNWKFVLQNNVLTPTLADNGGLTKTVALLADSPAIDTADSTLLPFLIKPVSVTTNTTGDFSSVSRLVDGAGVTVANYESVSNSTAWLTDDRNGVSGNDYFSSGANPVLEFDLGSQRLLSEVAIWGRSFGLNNDVSAFNLEFSTDGGQTFSAPISLTKERYHPNTNVVTTIPLGDLHEANFVRMTITDNHFGNTATPTSGAGDRVGFNEIRFLGKTVFDQRGPGFPRQIGLPDIGAFEAPFDGPLVVNSVGDDIDFDYSPGEFTLREAIGVASATPGADRIQFDEGLGVATIVLSGEDIDITDSLQIEGPGADRLTIDADEGSRIFEITGTDSLVTIEGITFINGNDTSGDGGGAILAEDIDQLMVVSSLFSNNTSTGDGGAIELEGEGHLIIEASTFTQNSADGGGGAVASLSRLDVANSTFTDNAANFVGGGIFAGSQGALRNSTVVRNIADADNNAGANRGGGISVLTNFLLNNTIVAGNTNAEGANFVDDDINNFGTVIGSNNIVGSTVSSGGLQNVINGNQVGVDWKTVVENDGTDVTLANNGGPIPTVNLISQGPAVNTGVFFGAADAFGNILTNDARGGIYPRFHTAGSNSQVVDVGAIEFVNSGVAGILQDDPNPTTSSSVSFSVDFLVPPILDPTSSNFSIVRTGSVTTNSFFSVQDLGDFDDRTWRITITGVQGTGTLTLAPNMPGVDFPVVETYDIIDDRHDLLDVHGRVPGNAAASISGSHLIITPDSRDNGVSVTQKANGDVVVAGQGGTTINGATEFVAFNGDLSRLTVNGSAGRDLIYVDGLNVTQDVQLTGGNSVDSLITRDLTAGTNLIIKEEAGDGFVDVLNANVGNVLQVVGDEGSDSVYLEAGTFAGQSFFQDAGTAANEADRLVINSGVFTGTFSASLGEGDDTIDVFGARFDAAANIATADGNDSIALRTITANQNLTINTGSGNDEFTVVGSNLKRKSTLQTEAGADTLIFSGSSLGSENTFNTGADPDAISLNNTVLNGPVTLRTLGGNDNITLTNVDAQSALTIDTGEDDDEVRFDGGNGGQLASVLLGNGDNTLQIEDLTVQGAFSANTGTGSDRLTVTDTTFLNRLNLNAGTGLVTTELNNINVAARLSVNASLATSDLTIEDSQLQAATVVRFGPDDDDFNVTGGTFIGVVSLRSGAGDDTIDIRPGEQSPVFENVVSLIAQDAAFSGDVIRLQDAEFRSNLNLTQTAGRADIDIIDSNVEQVVTLQLGSGADDISIDGGIYAAAVNTVLGGGGDNLRIVNDATFSQTFNLVGGADRDSLLFNNANFHRIRVNLLQGDDTLTINNGTVITDQANIELFTGQDTVNLQNATLNGQSFINTGSEDDILNIVDTISNGPMTLRTAGGSDTVTITNMQASGATTIDLGNENDVADLNQINTVADAGILLLTGFGNDQIRMRNSIFDHTVNVGFATGNKVVDLQASSFNRQLLVSAANIAGVTLGLRIEHNTIPTTGNPTTRLVGGATANDVLLERNNNFTGTNFVKAGFEDTTNALIDTAFEDLFDLLFP